ncbi:MAG TPA: haloacid dehalogenase-like hydrolase [Solirubrobacteraceae bacterium]|nr:haloacid dehalogenase-like hydrolase [Solirubrobacteraceae bacterium]
MLLLLFDIDGTLVAGAAKAHSQALKLALKEVHGVDPDDVRGRIGPAGRTDGEIARLILLNLGVSALRIDERADDVRDACCRIYAQICPRDLSSCVVPGIPEVLAWLSDRDGVQLGLLTGNFEPVARLKLKRAGLGKRFPSGVGAFGSDSEDRVTLPPIARRRAGKPGGPVARDETIVIGDTPRDIACARADGVRCVAVTSGQYGPDELADADAVATDANELREALRELGA